ncbi:MAG: NAD(P)/FAD-dependent oxidoreductase [Armatimonadota bacterium]|nr:NAD(P)/FAD-dependent oxidoreductase [bacterium]MDW8320024.1 NAD(P)/FAD-dependent oxidoreductase [Armatimonadota bacterium]
MPKRFVVIGGGSVGVYAAREAARLGAEVTLISEGEVGGRTTWDSLVPSKVLLTAADTLVDSHYVPHRGVKVTAEGAETADLMERIRQRTRQWGEQQKNALQQANVQVVYGVASFVDSHTAKVQIEGGNEQQISFDVAVIATGSVPIFPPSMKPDGKRILAPRFMSSLQLLPEHLIMVGGGVTGSEFAYLFRMLGSQVTVVTDMPRLLPRADEEVSRELEHAFQRLGIEVLLSSPVESVTAGEAGVQVRLVSGRTLEGSHAFIAIGRRSDLARLNLEAAGVHATPQGILLNEHLQTSVPHIYAVGDAAGPPFTLNRGWAQAHVAVRHALGMPKPPFRPELVVEAVYTQPQVAQVGIGEAQAREQGLKVETLRAEYAHNLKAQLLGETEGFVKLVVERGAGKLLGGSAIGSHAADILAPLSTAIALGGTVEQLASLFPAHPTLVELLNEAARG